MISRGLDAPKRYEIDADPDADVNGTVADPAVAAEAWVAWGQEITFTERAAATVFGRMPCPGCLGSEPVTFLEFLQPRGPKNSIP